MRWSKMHEVLVVFSIAMVGLHGLNVRLKRYAEYSDVKLLYCAC